MPRPKKIDRPVEWKVRIPASLAQRINARLPKDPLTGKIKHGERSKLAISLLRKWLEKEGKEYPEPEGFLDDLIEKAD